MKLTIVPTFEPEVIQAGIRKRHGDADKVATTACATINIRGIEISSRWGKAREMRELVDMANAIPVSLAGLVRSIFCDSSVGHSYEISLCSCRADQAQAADHLHGHCWLQLGGHNDIVVTRENGPGAHVEPAWNTTD